MQSTVIITTSNEKEQTQTNDFSPTEDFDQQDTIEETGDSIPNDEAECTQTENETEEETEETDAYEDDQFEEDQPDQNDQQEVPEDEDAVSRKI